MNEPKIAVAAPSAGLYYQIVSEKTEFQRASDEKRKYAKLPLRVRMPDYVPYPFRGGKK